ncbi:unnamed protein product, partial [marine sediment metagenome]
GDGDMLIWMGDEIIWMSVSWSSCARNPRE